jgi:hypothetical protein
LAKSLRDIHISFGDACCCCRMFRSTAEIEQQKAVADIE